MGGNKFVIALLLLSAVQYTGISSARADDWGYPAGIYHPNWTYFDWQKQSGVHYKNTVYSHNGCLH
jgi:hypothetical protein